MIFVLTFLILAAMVIIFFINSPRFGRLPSGARSKKILASPNFKNGSFQNEHNTPDLTEGVGMLSVLWEFIFSKKERVKPSSPLPGIKTDLHHLDLLANLLVWFGHSSYFMQVDGKTFLVDPVFSGAASPLAFTTRAFPGTDLYTTDDLPAIDFLIITHDHWDHLDHQTVLRLKGKIGKVICGLGAGAHLERWGYDPQSVFEYDWNESANLRDGFEIHTTPARHFSGRGLKRNQALWTSYVLKTPTHNIYIGGDSGYDSHFKKIEEQFGPFDLAILENGQYDKSWKYIHMMPEEVVIAAQDLRAKSLLPVHSAKFALANHDWDEPLIRVTKASAASNLRVLTPVIGEPVYLDDSHQAFRQWWRDVK